MKEGILYHDLKDVVERTRFIHIENRIEIGTPDIWFANPLNRGWLEAKQFTLPKKADTPIKVPFRQGQYNWIMDEVDHGGIVLLGMLTDAGYFFAVNKKIQEVYSKADFELAKTGAEGLLWYIDKKHFNWFFNNVPFVMA